MTTIYNSEPLIPISIQGYEDSKFLPVLVTDTREQHPLIFTRLRSVTGTLATGDYTLVGAENLFAIERKSIADLTGCCTGADRDRLERELTRLKAMRFKRLLIVGHQADIEAHRYRSKVSPKAVMASLACWEARFELAVCWASDPAEAARMVEGWAYWFGRETMKPFLALLKGSEAETRTIPTQKDTTNPTNRTPNPPQTTPI